MIMTNQKEVGVTMSDQRKSCSEIQQMCFILYFIHFCYTDVSNPPMPQSLILGSYRLDPNHC